MRLFINKDDINRIFGNCVDYGGNDVRALEFLNKLTDFINNIDKEVNPNVKSSKN